MGGAKGTDPPAPRREEKKDETSSGNEGLSSDSGHECGEVSFEALPRVAPSGGVDTSPESPASTPQPPPPGPPRGEDDEKCSHGTRRARVCKPSNCDQVEGRVHLHNGNEGAAYTTAQTKAKEMEHGLRLLRLLTAIHRLEKRAK